MATRIELNLPPRLLESARATQAANQRQLLNREQQTRDAREVRRQLRQAEAQGRTVRGRQQERRGNGVPEFPLSKGDWLPRRGGLGVGMCFCALTYDEDETAYTSYRLTTWKDHQIVSGALEHSYTGPRPSAEWGSSITINLPFNGYIPSYYASTTSIPELLDLATGQSSAVRENPKLAILPVNGNTFILVVLTQRSSFDGVAEIRTFRSYLGILVGRPIDYAGTGARSAPYVFKVAQTINIISGERSTSYKATCFVVNNSRSRQITCPSALLEFMKNNEPAEIPGNSQGLGVETGENVPYYPEPTDFGFTLGTPRTISAASNAIIDDWSKDWLQFSLTTPTSERFACRKISDLDPTTKEPVDLAAGRVVSGLARPVRPASMQGLQPLDTYFPLLAWDWGKPALCRQLLLQLGFSPADLTP